MGNKNIAGIILAAGAGTRMKSDMAKVIHNLCGISMIEWVLRAVQGVGLSKTAVVVGHKAEQVKKAICAYDVSFINQEKQLGTGHALMQAKTFLEDVEGTVLVICGDTPLITSETLKNAYLEHIKGKFAATVITAELDNPYGYGRIIRGIEGNIKKIVEEKDATEEEKVIREINSGIYFFDILKLLLALENISNKNSQQEYYLTDVVEKLVQDGSTVCGYKVLNQKEIIGINNRIQLAEAAKYLRRKIAEKHMTAGVSIINPDAVYIDVDVQIGMDTVLYPGTILEGKTEVGKHCVIGPDSRIVSSKIGDYVVINNSVILESTIGNETKIGPFAYIRPESDIGSKVKIGDFVEIKKSVIGDKTKISHLTYVGDAEIGENVNLGCGVVVVNYDGKQKHRTIVEDNAFIGCNVNLVSPVKIDANTYIAAGSTITKDVPEHSLAIARSKQTIIKDWVIRKGLIRK